MTASTPFTVALVQMACAEDTAANLATARDQVEAARDAGADLVCLPELFLSRYFCQEENAASFDRAEPIDGPSLRALSDAARAARVTVVAPFFERRAAGVYHNALVVLGPDGQRLGHYRKMHIPDDPSYYEKFYFAPGDLGFRAFDTPQGRIGALICWDQWYPEAARMVALMGATILFYPTAIGWLPDEKASAGQAHRDAWRTIQRSHAIANGIYVASVNRVGFEPSPTGTGGLEFWGSSFLCDPMGEILAQAPDDEPALLLAEVDPGRAEAVRREWPFLRDRRVDAYHGLTERYLD